MELKKCLICHNIFDRPLRANSSFKISWTNYKNRRFCSSKCRGIWTSQTFIGAQATNFKGGKSKCSDCNKELPYRYSWRSNTRCKSCWHEFAKKENHPRWKGGYSFPKCTNCKETTNDRYSKLCRKCYRGELSPLWKGGISKLASLIRVTPTYKQWVKNVFKRDSYTCQNCFNKSNRLTAHHIKGFAIILEENNIKSIQEAIDCIELWSITNGQTLCRPCHRLTDNFGHKGRL